MPTPFLRSTDLPRYTRRAGRARGAAIGLALGLGAGGLAVGCAGDDDDEAVEPVTRETLSTADVSETLPADYTQPSIVVHPAGSEPSTEPVTELPDPLDPCALVAPDAIATLLGPADPLPSEGRCRWESSTGYLDLLLEPIPVGVSQIETLNARADLTDPDAPAVEGVGQFASLDAVDDRTQIYVVWGGWTAVIASDQPLDAVTVAVSGLPTS
jgi:hypothetical protein